MKLLSTALLLLSLNSAAVAAEMDEAVIQIELLSQVVVAGRDYSLSDIAQIEGSNSGAVEKLAQIRVGISPQRGYVEQISKSKVRSHIERNAPRLKDKIVWRGSEITKIKMVGNRVDAGTYKATAERFLVDWLDARVDTSSVSFRGKAEDLFVPEGELTLTPRVLPSASLAKRMNVWIDVAIDGHHYQSVPVWFAVEAYADALVAKAEIARGSVFRSASFTKERVDISLIDGELFVPEVDGLGLRVKTSLREGEVLLQNNLEPVPPVIKGQQVAVQSNIGSVRVTAMATALEDGHKGDRVEVQRLDGEATYTVWVVGEGAATVGGRRYE